MRVGIVGGGFGIDGHLAAIVDLPEVKLIAVADSGSGRVLSRLSKPSLYRTSWRDLLDSDIDTVCIATPAFTHLELVETFLDSHKHILCEKPFGLNPVQAKRMVMLARNAGVVAAVSFQYRFEPGFQTIKHYLSSGHIGRLQSIECVWLTSGRRNPNLPWTWRNDAVLGGGVLSNFMCHIIDLIQWLTESNVAAVQSASNKVLVLKRPLVDGRMAKVTAEDVAIACFELDNGVLVDCHVSNCYPQTLGMRMELRGEIGSLVYTHTPPFNVKTQQVHLHVQGTSPQLLFNAAEQLVSDQVDTRIPALSTLLKRFSHKVACGNEPELPTFEDGWAVQCILQAVRQSAITCSKVNCLLDHTTS